MFLFADIVVRNLPGPLVTPASSTSAHERHAASSPLATLPDIPSGSLLCARLRN